jgi:hypothetical protein
VDTLSRCFRPERGKSWSGGEGKQKIKIKIGALPPSFALARDPQVLFAVLYYYLAFSTWFNSFHLGPTGENFARSSANPE